MKRKIFVTLIIVFCCAFTSFSTDLSGASVNDIDLPPVSRLTLNNGVKIIYIQDDLPRLSITASIGFGKIYEDKNNAGLSELLAKTLSLSGSKKYPAQVLHSSVENIGGRFGVAASWEDIQISITVLERYSDLAFDIINDMLVHPNFDQGLFENARSLILEGIMRKEDNPDQLVFEKLREVIFNGSSYGATPTVETVKSLTISDLQTAVSTYFNAGNLMIGISGPNDFVDVKKTLTSSFKELKKGKAIDYTVSTKSVISDLKQKSKKVYLIPKDIPQAIIAAGTVGPDIKNADTYSLELMNFILGGGDFTSRLMQEIRVKRGLAYDTQSVMRFRKKTGIFIAYVQTNENTADLAMRLLIDNIKNMGQSDVTGTELQTAQNSIRNSYIFEFSGPLQILGKQLFITYNNLPESYLSDYTGKIDKIAAGDIRRSAGRMLDNGLIKVVVGKEELVEKLKEFGEVVVLKK